MGWDLWGRASVERPCCVRTFDRSECPKDFSIISVFFYLFSILLTEITLGDRNDYISQQVDFITANTGHTYCATLLSCPFLTRTWIYGNYFAQAMKKYIDRN